jgi:hypothetical protein
VFNSYSITNAACQSISLFSPDFLTDIQELRTLSLGVLLKGRPDDGEEVGADDPPGQGLEASGTQGQDVHVELVRFDKQVRRGGLIDVLTDGRVDPEPAGAGRGPWRGQLRP